MRKWSAVDSTSRVYHPVSGCRQPGDEPRPRRFRGRITFWYTTGCRQLADEHRPRMFLARITFWYTTGSGCCCSRSPTAIRRRHAARSPRRGTGGACHRSLATRRPRVGSTDRPRAEAPKARTPGRVVVVRAYRFDRSAPRGRAEGPHPGSGCCCCSPTPGDAPPAYRFDRSAPRGRAEGPHPGSGCCCCSPRVGLLLLRVGLLRCCEGVLKPLSH